MVIINQENLALVQPFDLILFRGSEGVSLIISAAQNLQLGSGRWTHVGVAVDSSVMKISGAKPGVMYIWESTWSGSIVDSESGRRRLGVQIRPLLSVCKNYSGDIAVAKLKPEVRAKINTKGLADLHTKYFGRTYSLNLWSCGLCCALFPCIRARKKSKKRSSTPGSNWVFCSQFVAIVYQEIGILDRSLLPEHVVPMDFLGLDQDGMPLIVESPLTIK